jgi:hypothetical protein
LKKAVRVVGIVLKQREAAGVVEGQRRSPPFTDRARQNKAFTQQVRGRIEVAPVTSETAQIVERDGYPAIPLERAERLKAFL